MSRTLCVLVASSSAQNREAHASQVDRALELEAHTGACAPYLYRPSRGLKDQDRPRVGNEMDWFFIKCGDLDPASTFPWQPKCHPLIILPHLSCGVSSDGFCYLKWQASTG